MYNLIATDWAKNQVFSLSQLYMKMGELEHLFPKNRHVEEKIRQTLQHLREDGMIDFVDNDGHYRRVR